MSGARPEEIPEPRPILIQPHLFSDLRGFFCEIYNQRRLSALGIEANFVQDNLSRSRCGTLRGLHFQQPHGQGKLVTVLDGDVWDVTVDIRMGSAGYGKWLAFDLSAGNRRAVWIPPGFAHGFCVRSESADFYYKCTDVYSPESERVIRWDDPDIGISWPWPISGGKGPVLSDRDRNAPLLKHQPALPIWTPRT